MNRSQRVVIAVLALAALGVAVCSRAAAPAAAAPEGKPTTMLSEALRSKDPRVRAEALSRVASERSAIIGWLMWIVEKGGEAEEGVALPPGGVHEEKLAMKRHHEQYGGSGPSMREKNLERLIAMYEKIGTSGRKYYPPRPSPGEVLPEDQDYPRESTKVKPNPPEMEKGPRER